MKVIRLKIVSIMPVRFLHVQKPQTFYFITFTCYNWISLFDITNTYDAVYKWYDWLFERNIFLTGYVTMPNHLHCILYFLEMKSSLYKIIGNGKRFLAYEIIEKLEENKSMDLLNYLHGDVKKREKKKGQVHRVFNESFDAKECYSTEFLLEKLNYIHHNPVRKKWNLVNDFHDYNHSSASFYEKGIKKYEKITHYNDVWNIPGVSSKMPE